MFGVQADNRIRCRAAGRRFAADGLARSAQSARNLREDEDARDRGRKGPVLYSERLRSSAVEPPRIAVVSEALTNPYYPELVEPIRRQLADHGYRTVLLTDGAEGAVELDELADGSYDGVILTTTTRASRLPRELTERGIPHVLVNRLLDHAESSSCGVDNRGGTSAIADLLVSLGHTVIACCGARHRPRPAMNAPMVWPADFAGAAWSCADTSASGRSSATTPAGAVAFELLTGFDRRQPSSATT